MKNLFVLPTDKPSRLYEGVNKELKFTDHLITGKRILCQNIYITSGEKIKDGDWFIYRCYKLCKCTGLSQAKQILVNNEIAKHEYYGKPQGLSKKIILTTDQDLIKDGVQSIDDEFLQWFLKNPSCEEVNVIIEYKDGYGNWFIYNKEFWDKHDNRPKFGTRYKIIIPKEEVKQCCDSGIVDDFCINTLKCKNAVGEPKQETLEEAAIEYSKMYFSENKKAELGFIAGAKWQQERSYNEEEVKEILTKCTWILTESKLKWFEQFKKK